VNFEDERYVRMYTRKTLTKKLLGWDGRACLNALLLECVDRAGVLELDGLDPAEVLSALSDLPLDIARSGMAKVLERGVAVVRNGVLFVPNFLAAQEAKQSDAQRQRESRARRAALARASGLVGSVEQPVTQEHVTAGDASTEFVTAPSREVTRGHSQLSSAQLSRTDQEPDLESIEPAGPPAPLELKPPASAGAAKRPRRWTRVPADWQPKPEHVDLAMRLGVPIGEEAEKFRDHEFRSPKSDADACFRTWLKNSLEFRRTAAGVRVAQGAGRAADALERQMSRAHALRKLETQTQTEIISEPKALPT